MSAAALAATFGEPTPPLSAEQSATANAYGRKQRSLQAKNLRRAIPAARDTELAGTFITDRLVKEAQAVVDRDPELVAWAEEKVEAMQVGPGRPGALSIRTALVCFWLLAVTKRSFHIINLPPMFASMSPRARKDLGIDYLDGASNPRQITYSQLLTVFSNLADALDPFAETLSDEEASGRAADLQEFSNRLVRASAWDHAHKGDYAVDATMVWSWDRPPHSSNKKIERRGHDGDLGRPLALSEIAELDELTEDDLSAAGFVEDPIAALRGATLRANGTPPEPTDPAAAEVKAWDPATGQDDNVPDPFGSADTTAPTDGSVTDDSAVADGGSVADGGPVADGDPGTDGGSGTHGSTARAAAARATRRSRRTKRPGTWGKGAAWAGRNNKAKSVYGYALHTATVTDPTHPPVVEALAVTPAPAMPAMAATPLLRHLHDVRTADPALADPEVVGELRPLGKVVADPAYSINVTRWQLPIRDMGGDAVFRLHRTMQAGRRQVRGETFIDGRPHCRCAPDALAERFPKFPYSRTTLERHQQTVALRDGYEMKPNGGYRPNGSRQFLTPHFSSGAPSPNRRTTANGGCEHCVDQITGQPVVTPATGQPRPRCCTQRTKTFSREELGLYQLAVHGSKEWEADWNPRNRVEGTYGILKSLALVNWHHDFHHFVGLARETLVATFAVMAMNYHVQRTWKVRRELCEEPPAHPGALPSKVPTQTTPQGMAAARRERAAAERQATRKGPKGLEFLGTSPSAP